MGVAAGPFFEFKKRHLQYSRAGAHSLRLPVGLPGSKFRAQPVFDSKGPEEISIWVSVKHAGLAYACPLKACSPVKSAKAGRFA